MHSGRQGGTLRRVARLAMAALGLFFSGMALAGPPVLISGVTVIDGTGVAPRPDQDVLIDKGRIAAIGQGLSAPRGATRVDGRGRYLLPGFIDSNVHATVYGNPARRDTSSRYADRNEDLALEFAQRQLKAGVTTIRDSYGVLPPLLAVRDRIARGEATGARMLVAGNILGWGGPFSLTYSLTGDRDLTMFQEQWNDILAQGMGEELMDMTPEELRVAVSAYLDRGVDFLKYGGTSHFTFPSLIGFSPRQQRVIVEEAHKRGRIAETHATSPEGLYIAVEAGIDLIQHPEILSRDYPQELIDLILSKGTLCAIRANMVTGAVRQRQIEKRAAALASIAKMPPARTSTEVRRRAVLRGEDDEIQRRNAERLIKAGCPVTIATDNYLGDAPEFRRSPKTPDQEPGEGSLLAIEGLVELGMSPMDAIVAATRNGARATGRLNELGTIETGKIADLLLLGADPTADIRNIRRLERLFFAGEEVDLAALPHTRLFMEAPAQK
ncbi:putative hydrolase [Sphingobium sp. SYK-6]|uniref:amidohydrolase family protein n=1 Tax=Sphingobium sp. (strain NBRC 103272 / SYK-6) TaxID=627192 RepID=UPI000227762E|nr:amidohydrolase family protein [Sphingobium sp. SYK-6]BAK67846.1 putative hydrolase [Sphingobium sp. SYK-6]